MATRRVATDKYRENPVPYPKLRRLKCQKMDERRENKLCFNCENQYSKGHKSSEKKLFYINYESEEYKESKPS